MWFTTHFGGGFASGAQIYSYFVRYGIWCLIMPVLAMLYNTVFFAYSLRFARKHECMITVPNECILRKVRTGLSIPLRGAVYLRDVCGACRRFRHRRGHAE